MTDAGGLVIASDQQSARAYAKLIGQLTGEKAVVVLSDDAGASGRIAAFAGSTQRWMVAVRMVSEGVDIPRLAVGVYATSASTPLFFAQAIGRFVRARRPGETASVFVPSVAHLLELASDMEVHREMAAREGGAQFGKHTAPARRGARRPDARAEEPPSACSCPAQTPDPRAFFFAVRLAHRTLGSVGRSLVSVWITAS